MPIHNKIDKTKLKQKSKGFRRKFKLMWRFRNVERISDYNEKFRPKSTFNPKNKDVVIETYPRFLEEKLLNNDILKDKF